MRVPGQTVRVTLNWLLLCGLLHAIHAISHTWTPNDVITREEMSSKLLAFPKEGDHTNFFKVLLQENDRLIVGARNKMYNISMQTLQHDAERVLEWRPNSKDNTSCSYMIKDHSKCQNFIQVLGKMKGDKYYVCGTNAFNPKCREYVYKEANYPAQVPGFVSDKENEGIGASPYDPEHNSTSIFVDGKLYSGTVADRLARDPLIIESMTRIRTEQHDSNMLKDPHFVSSYDINDKVYFFLREDAVENINCGKATFSRVARICKKDKGGIFDYEQGIWTSFFKARLRCSVPGDIPFHFDELQSTSGLSLGSHIPTKSSADRQKMFYGVFNTPDNSIQGFAVCAFKLADIDNAFVGQFKAQQTTAHAWTAIPQDKTPDPHPAKACVNDSQSLPDETLTFIRDHPLMDRDINPAGGAPVLIQTQETSGRFTAIAVDVLVLAADDFYYDVMFVGTSDGRVLKAVNTGQEGSSGTVIEDIQVLSPQEAIRELRIYRGTGHEKLIVISRDNIVSIPLHRCHRHKTCGDCVALQDPYCGWFEGACTTHTSRGYQDIQSGDTKKCPDGGKQSDKDGLVVEDEVNTEVTEKPVEVSTCKPCQCNCNQSDSDTAVYMETSQNDNIGNGQDPSKAEIDMSQNSAIPQPCETKYIRTDDQIYTASTLAIACVVAIVVAALIGFVIGYRVSMCRVNTRNTEQMINIEQNFGSLRKNGNRHSIEASHNIYNEPQKMQQKIQNNLVTNYIPEKNPNLPNGSVDSRTVTPKQASKTYL
ncbi:semaphorin-1A-like isoform X2 [Mya arenaria]|uniref:semaphorin-1A-like isoform X2 n=1 Tax=Mya arenaria TaxID=6604 RepID=UPI0022E72991|nr:semaphorin-1A-like isoform X2 [Mya arenaria]